MLSWRLLPTLPMKLPNLAPFSPPGPDLDLRQAGILRTNNPMDRDHLGCPVYPGFFAGRIWHSGSGGINCYLAFGRCDFSINLCWIINIVLASLAAGWFDDQFPHPGRFAGYQVAAGTIIGS